MKGFKIILLFLFLSKVAFAQDQTVVNFLIRDLTNNELVGQCNYFWSLKPRPGIVDLLIHIGKPATPQLIDVLTAQNKGIVAHYILSKIWLNSTYTTISAESYRKDQTIKYQIGSLNFYENETGFFTKPGALEKLRDEWQVIVNKNRQN